MKAVLVLVVLASASETWRLTVDASTGKVLESVLVAAEASIPDFWWRSGLDSEPRRNRQQG
jgi:hypothetical protein